MNQGPTPVGVKVVSIIGIIWGILTLLGSLWGIVSLSVRIGPPNPALDALYNDPAYVGAMVISSILGFALGLLLLAASIGSLNLRSWARKGMLIYAGLACANTILGTIISFAFVIPKMTETLARTSPAAAEGAKIGGIIGGGCGIILGLALPVAIFAVFNSPTTKDAFNGIFPASPTNFPVEYPQA